jgi:flagellar motor component MotA
MKILKFIMVILGPFAAGALIGGAAAISGVELPSFFVPAVVFILIAAFNNALKTENTKSRVKSILLISLVPFLIVIA